jgi:hypothetical protein
MSFKKAKFGFVHIPEFHWTTEEMIKRFIDGNQNAIDEYVFEHLLLMDQENCWSPQFSEFLKQTNVVNDFEIKAYLLVRQQLQLVNGLFLSGPRNTTVTFQDYYSTEYWQYTRFVVLEAQFYSCALCGSNSNLQVHHKTYDRIGCESYLDLMVLCKKCHKIWHKAKRGVDVYDRAKDFLKAFELLERAVD